MLKQLILIISGLVLTSLFWFIVEIAENNILFYFALPIVWIVLIWIVVLLIKNIIKKEKAKNIKFSAKKASFNSVLNILIATCLTISLLFGIINIGIALFFNLNMLDWWLDGTKKDIYCAGCETETLNQYNCYCCDCLVKFQEKVCYKCFTADEW